MARKSPCRPEFVQPERILAKSAKRAQVRESPPFSVAGDILEPGQRVKWHRRIFFANARENTYAGASLAPKAQVWSSHCTHCRRTGRNRSGDEAGEESDEA